MIKQNIANRIKKIRKSKGLTQRALAEQAGLNYRHFQDLEAGKINVSVGSLAAIAQTMAVSIGALVTDSGNWLLENFDIWCPTQILKNLNCVVVISDLTGLVHFSNIESNSFISMQNAGLKSGMYIWELAPTQEEVTRIKIKLSSIIESKPKPEAFETSFLDSSGNLHPVSINWSYIFDSKGEILGFISLIVSSNRKAKVEFAISDHDMSEFSRCSDCPKNAKV